MEFLQGIYASFARESDFYISVFFSKICSLPLSENKPMDISIIEDTIKALKNNNFEVFSASDPEEARTIFLNEIYTQLQPATVSWGGFPDAAIYSCIG